MSSNTKWLPFYVADYLGDTMHLSTLQHGAYMLLLLHYWRSGPLPSDQGQLAAIAKLDTKAWQTVWPVLQPFFTANGDGTLHQKRMDWELKRWAEISDKRSNAGKRGAEAKHRPHPTKQDVAPQHPSETTTASSKTDASSQSGGLAIARNLPVDNLANATDLPHSLPDVCQPKDGNCQDFASVLPAHTVHPQSNNISYLREESPARARRDPPPEQNLPPDGLRELLTESLRQAEANDAWREAMRPKQSHTSDVQKTTVAKPRPSPKACPLTGDHLLRERKRAGMVA